MLMLTNHNTKDILFPSLHYQGYQITIFAQISQLRAIVLQLQLKFSAELRNVCACFRNKQKFCTKMQNIQENLRESFLLPETLVYIFSALWSMFYKLANLHFKDYAVFWCIRQIQVKNVRFIQYIMNFPFDQM